MRCRAKRWIQIDEADSSPLASNYFTVFLGTDAHATMKRQLHLFTVSKSNKIAFSFPFKSLGESTPLRKKLNPGKLFGKSRLEISDGRIHFFFFFA